ncbi:hypothetical protein MTsPCn5_01720 [Croceitalea sp. MTPC5]|nr:hypothetical protein MTsPCn5_01720 [Croceitalea sp. MTPC5]
MAFEKYSTEKLKRTQKSLLIFSIVALLLMCVALAFGLYQSSKHHNNTLIFLVPTVFGPLAIIPNMVSASIGNELKKRNKTNS